MAVCSFILNEELRQLGLAFNFHNFHPRSPIEHAGYSVGHFDTNLGIIIKVVNRYIKHANAFDSSM